MFYILFAMLCYRLNMQFQGQYMLNEWPIFSHLITKIWKKDLIFLLIRMYSQA